MKKKIYSLIIITTLMLMAQIAVMGSATHSTINADEDNYVEVCFSESDLREF
ncbi:MAG: hypothetical protein Q4C58_00430 [Eubacteriales bacterium]|nr:hypothetical protein [Eubacteriales bacterium]